MRIPLIPNPLPIPLVYDHTLPHNVVVVGAVQEAIHTADSGPALSAGATARLTNAAQEDGNDAAFTGQRIGDAPMRKHGTTCPKCNNQERVVVLHGQVKCLRCDTPIPNQPAAQPTQPTTQRKPGRPKLMAGAAGKRVRTNLTLRQSVVEGAKAKASMEGVSLSSVVEQYLKSYSQSPATGPTQPATQPPAKPQPQPPAKPPHATHADTNGTHVRGREGYPDAGSDVGFTILGGVRYFENDK